MSAGPRLGQTFTPVFDAVVQELGNLDANVYGRVWRYCQGRKGECYASNRTIAEALGLGRASVNRSLKRLVAAGYLDDLTPGLRFVPHRYRITGKRGASSEQAPVAQGNTVNESLLRSATDEPKTVVVDNRSLPQDMAYATDETGAVVLDNRAGSRVSHSGTHEPESVPHSRLKRQVKRQAGPIQESPRGAARPPKANQIFELRLYHEVTGFFPHRLLFEDVIDAIRTIEGRLGRKPVAADLKPYFIAWILHGWKPTNVAWLMEWALSGAIPTYRPKGDDKPYEYE